MKPLVTKESTMSGLFAHEVLHAYRVALEVARWVRRARWPRGDAHLKDQARRAADSVVLNLAEGASHEKGHRPKHFAIAKASAAEVAASLELAQLAGWEEQVAKLRRVKRMAERLR